MVLPFPMAPNPGVKRDGTQFEGNFYTDAQWCRWNDQGKPRKIGGYRALNAALSGPVYAAFLNSTTGPLYNVHFGSATGVERIQITPTATSSGVISRTPAGYTSAANNLWQFDAMNDVSDGYINLVAFVAANLADQSNAVGGNIYVGNINTTTALAATGASLPAITGGIVCIPGYLVFYGSNGQVGWFAKNSVHTYTGNPASDGSGVVSITSSKILKGLPLRGGNVAPAALLWSEDGLFRMTFAGSPTYFNFDEVSDQVSVMSPNGIIEKDGIYYWMARDRFMIYNGTVQELPNSLNLNYVFDNLNYTYQQKVWATKIDRFGEIWWFYPSGSSTECNQAVIYNVRLNTWYDSVFARSAGIQQQIYNYPVWVDLAANSVGKYTAWRHEDRNGNTPQYDQITLGGASLAVPSWFTTCDYGHVVPINGNPGADKNISLEFFEPDGNFTGTINATIKTYEYADGGAEYPNGMPDKISQPYPFTSATAFVTIQPQDRQAGEMYMTFMSNQAGGYYEFGQTVLYFNDGDNRR